MPRFQERAEHRHCTRRSPTASRTHTSGSVNSLKIGSEVSLGSIQSILTRMIGGKDLRQKHAECDPRGEGPGSPFVLVSAAGRLDLAGGQDIEERKPRLLGKLVPDSLDLAADRRGRRLDHGDLLVVVDWFGFGATKLPRKEATNLLQ